MAETYDVIVVGGGMAGLSTAYHLARLGARTLLLQARDLGAGSSAACAGRAQTAEGHLDPLNLQLIRDGLARFDTLEEELGLAFGWRRTNLLCLINSHTLWDAWMERARILTAAGIPIRLLDPAELQAAEPFLKAAGFLGAAHAVEGQVDPFLFCWAYACAARRLGAILLPHTPVTAMEVEGRRVVAVEAGHKRFQAGRVAIMCGAWTARVARLAGATVPINHTHAEALITQPVWLPLDNTIEMADFYETIHGQARAVSVGFNRGMNGGLVVTEAVTQTGELHRRTSAWGISAIAAGLASLYPALKDVCILRAWGAPTPFTPDDEPVIGWLPERDNLFVAAGFLLTITALPVLSEWLARMLLGEQLPVDLSLFAPSRFAKT